MNTENNKLIAEFLGFNLTTDGIQTLYYDKENHLKALPKFDTDWNWLMEVVEKIESLGYGTSIAGGKDKYACVISVESGLSFIGNYLTNTTKIEAVYNACVEFIEWYNQNK